MTITTKILSSPHEFAALREDWNSLVRDEPNNLLGLDGTSTYEWFETIINAFPEAASPKVIIASEGNRTLGILPVVEIPSRFSGKQLQAPTELYGGRNGPLLAEPNPEILATMLAALDEAYPGWMTYRHTLVTQTDTARVMQQACQANELWTHLEVVGDSLFFPICRDEKDYWQAMGKDLKSRIRSSEKKLGSPNAEIILYGQGDDAAELLANVLAVERDSWKHQAGTAITNHPRQERFYRELFPKGLENDLLKAVVIQLDGQPISYCFGILKNRVFCSLKTSMAQAHEKLSPAHFAHHKLLQSLRSCSTDTFDFMGVIDPHKLRWSNMAQHYTRQTWIVHNRNLIGRAAWLVRKFKSSFLTRHFNRSSTQDSHVE